MNQWKIKKSVTVQADDLPLHPIGKMILAQRQISGREQIEKFIDPIYERDLYDPFCFSEMRKSMERIKEALIKKEKIAIYGDYDVDGVTSTIVVNEVLSQLSFESIIYIPDKKSEGYGLNKSALGKLAKENVKLIITVDCGITSIQEIDLANDLGIDVIILDHHHVPKKKPRALAIINPQDRESAYPFPSLAGVGVAFKFAQALIKTFLPEKIESLKWLLDLVALGTVADCVPLIDENRVLVKYGLIVLGKTKRIGLQELFRVGRINIDENKTPNVRQISFLIAPRINAAGRMDHANEAYKLLIETDRVKARNLSLEIESKNQRRQKETEEIFNEVKQIAEKNYKDKKFILAAAEHFSIGIAGLVAGKIADYYNKPACILQKEKDICRGSLRSIPQINIIDILENCQSLLLKFGGHSQAAGININHKDLEQFEKTLNSLIEIQLGGREIIPEIEIDCVLEEKDIDFALAETINKMAPFGIGNEEPIFLTRDLEVVEIMKIGNNSQHMKMILKAQGKPKFFEAILFNHNSSYDFIKKGDFIDLVFNLQIDCWNGNKKLLLRIIDFRRSAERK